MLIFWENRSKKLFFLEKKIKKFDFWVFYNCFLKTKISILLISSDIIFCAYFYRIVLIFGENICKKQVFRKKIGKNWIFGFLPIIFWEMKEKFY